jgi:hypothetical protein
LLHPDKSGITFEIGCGCAARQNTYNATVPRDEFRNRNRSHEILNLPPYLGHIQPCSPLLAGRQGQASLTQKWLILQGFSGNFRKRLYLLAGRQV